jgi:opacity protein-like surface antigen
MSRRRRLPARSQAILARTAGAGRSVWASNTPFLPNWSAKIEYDFIDFGSQTYNFPVTSTAVGATNFANWSYTLMVHEMKLGVNYHF